MPLVVVLFGTLAVVWLDLDRARGVAVVDAGRRLAANTRPPPVHIETAEIDFQPVAMPAVGQPLVLAPGQRRLDLSYVGLSLVDPGAVRFRFTGPERLDVLECNCSICSKTGTHLAFVGLQGRQEPNLRPRAGRARGQGPRGHRGGRRTILLARRAVARLLRGGEAAEDHGERRGPADARRCAVPPGREVVTGLLYVDPDARDFHQHPGTVETPLNKLGTADLCPGGTALDKLNASLR